MQHVELLFPALFPAMTHACDPQRISNLTNSATIHTVTSSFVRKVLQKDKRGSFATPMHMQTMSLLVGEMEYMNAIVVEWSSLVTITESR